jgi:hypothetical protein
MEIHRMDTRKHCHTGVGQLVDQVLGDKRGDAGVELSAAMDPAVWEEISLQRNN